MEAGGGGCGTGASAPAKPRNFRKKARDADDDDAGVGSGGVVVSAPPAKRHAGAAAIASTARSGGSASAADAPLLHAYESTRSAEPHAYGGGAFATSEIDTAHDRDGLALLQKQLAAQTEAAQAIESGAAREYRGLASYSNFIVKDAAEAKSHAKVSGSVGPLRAPTHLRGTVRIDYKPDICKDYKDTGFCTFGDSCIFMHDRSDYKAGWQLDREWDAEQKLKRAALAKRLAEGGAAAAEGDASEDAAATADADNLPFACFICRGAFASPVVTQCGHFFCERCALERFATNSRCASCDKQTLGIFNTAKKLITRLAERDRERGAAGADGARAAPPSRAEGASSSAASASSSSSSSSSASSSAAAAADSAGARADAALGGGEEGADEGGGGGGWVS